MSMRLAMNGLIRASLLGSLFTAFGAMAADTPEPANEPMPTTLRTLAGPVRVESLAKLDNPWGMTTLPDGRLLITEKPGRLRFYADGKLSDPIAGVPKVEAKDQGGLLDVEIDPAFAENGFVYLSYTEAAEDQPKDAKIVPDPRLGPYVDEKDTVLKGTAVARGRLDGSQLRDVTVIWRQAPKIVGLNHFGGRLAFAADGKLLIASGDRQSFDPAQDMTGNVGKIVRIEADGAIPTDNPFTNKDGTRSDVWSSGHRNPLGMAVEASSRRLWVHEMGPLGGDEINIVEAGRNYGWPVVSNGDHYDKAPIPRHATRPEFVAPEKSWNPSISPSGLALYDGTLFPSWRGGALIGGLSSKNLIRLTIEDGRVTGEERIDVKRRVRDVMQQADGSVLLLSDGDDGELLRLSPGTGSGT